jgi:hypothetical protein
MITMKATLDIPEPLYRQLKAQSALEGVTVREVAIHLFTQWTTSPASMPFLKRGTPSQKVPSWFGGAKRYVKDADRHDMASIRDSITAGRATEFKK